MQVLPLEQARLLQELSKFGLLSGTVGILSGYPFLGAGVCVGSVIAQTYWANPVYGWWRALDMTWIQMLIWTHLSVVWGTPALPVYATVQGLGVLLYGLSWWYHAVPWVNAYLHGGVHLCANLSLLYFYLSSLLFKTDS